MNPIDDDSALEALLDGEPAPDDADAFTAAVMRRVRAETATLDAAAALAELRQRELPARHARRWTRIGAVAGALLALGAALWPDPGSNTLDGAQTLALLAAGAVAAWALATRALQDGN